MTKVNRNAAVIDSGNWIILKAATMISSVTPPTRHSVSSEGVIIFFIFLFFLYKLITFKPVQSYNVKHLTCTISCSSGLQNIYKLHIWKCSTFTIFTLLHLFTNNKKGYYIYKTDQKVFKWAPSDAWPFTTDVDCPVLWFPLLYLHG